MASRKKELDQAIINQAVEFCTQWPYYLTGTDAERYKEIAAVMDADVVLDHAGMQLAMELPVLRKNAQSAFAEDVVNREHPREMAEAAACIARNHILEARAQLRSEMEREGVTVDDLERHIRERLFADNAKRSGTLADLMYSEMFADAKLYMAVSLDVAHCLLAMIADENGNRALLDGVAERISDFIHHKWEIEAGAETAPALPAGGLTGLPKHKPSDLGPAANALHILSQTRALTLGASFSYGTVVSNGHNVKMKRMSAMLKPAEGITLSRPLRPFDLEVLDAAFSIHKDRGEDAEFDISDLYNTLTGQRGAMRQRKTERGKKRRETGKAVGAGALYQRVHESVEYMRGIVAYYDVADSLKSRRVSQSDIDRFAVSANLLSLVGVHGYAANGKEIDNVYKFNGEQLYFLYADLTKQYCTLPPKARRIPEIDNDKRIVFATGKDRLHKRDVDGNLIPHYVQMTETRIVIMGYLARRIGAYKHDVARYEAECQANARRPDEKKKPVKPVKMSSVILLDTLVAECDLDAGPNLSREINGFVPAALEHWQRIGFIDGYDMEKRKVGRGEKIERITIKWSYVL